jgi:hypothetical protein
MRHDTGRICRARPTPVLRGRFFTVGIKGAYRRMRYCQSVSPLTPENVGAGRYLGSPNASPPHRR